MIDDISAEVAAIGVRVLDDAYLGWFSAEADCERALRAWCDGTGGDSSTEYFAYRAALDREEAAARDLQRLWKLTTPCRESLVHGNKSVCE